MTSAALRIEGLSIERRAPGSSLRLVIERFGLDRGEAVALTGPSGCGKSTLLDLLAMVLWPERVGCMRVFVPGDESLRDVTTIVRERRQSEAARLRAVAFGYVLQTGGLLPFLTVRQNVEVADPAGMQSPPVVRERIERLAQTLGIAPKLDALPGALSVGERQRAAILRALVKRPTILLADEPTANLDPQTSRTSLRLLLDAARGAGAAVLVVSHDHALIEAMDLPEWRLETVPVWHGAEGAESRLVSPSTPGGPDAMSQPRSRP